MVTLRTVNQRRNRKRVLCSFRILLPNRKRGRCSFVNEPFSRKRVQCWFGNLLPNRKRMLCSFGILLRKRKCLLGRFENVAEMRSNGAVSPIFSFFRLWGSPLTRRGHK